MVKRKLLTKEEKEYRKWKAKENTRLRSAGLPLLPITKRTKKQRAQANYINEIRFERGCENPACQNIIHYPNQLHLHHIDEETKAFDISKIGRSVNLTKLHVELDKCICLCHNCHFDFHWGPLEIPDVSKPPYTAKIAGTQPRKCADYVKQHKIDNPECSECGLEFGYYNLQFHHLDPSTKLFTLGRLVKIPGLNLEMVQAEIDKCILMCGNCHSKLTWEENYGKIYNGVVS